MTLPVNTKHFNKTPIFHLLMSPSKHTTLQQKPKYQFFVTFCDFFQKQTWCCLFFFVCNFSFLCVGNPTKVCRLVHVRFQIPQTFDHRQNKDTKIEYQSLNSSVATCFCQIVLFLSNRISKLHSLSTKSTFFCVFSQHFRTLVFILLFFFCEFAQKKNTQN